MNLRFSKLGLCACIFALTPVAPGFSQGGKDRVAVEGSLGFTSYSKSLPAVNGLSIKLAVDYGIRNFLRLGMSFSANPNRQRTTTAISKINTDLMVYKYNMNLTLIKPGTTLATVRPFVKAGAGGLVLNPGKSVLPLGAGRTLTNEPATEHKLAMTLGAGLHVAISSVWDAVFHVDKSFFRMNRIAAGEVTGQTWASATFLGLGLSVRF